MSRNPDPPALSREDRANLRDWRRIQRQRVEDERLMKQIGRLLLDLRIRLALSSQAESQQ